MDKVDTEFHAVMRAMCREYGHTVVADDMTRRAEAAAEEWKFSADRAARRCAELEQKLAEQTTNAVIALGAALTFGAVLAWVLAYMAGRL